MYTTKKQVSENGTPVNVAICKAKNVDRREVTITFPERFSDATIANDYAQEWAKFRRFPEISPFYNQLQEVMDGMVVEAMEICKSHVSVVCNTHEKAPEIVRWLTEVFGEKASFVS